MKKFIYKFIVLFVTIFFLQIVITKLFVPKILEVTMLDEYLKNGTEIIFLGDSVIDSVAESDKDKSSIVAIISKMNPSLTIRALTHGGYHLGVYEVILKNISKSKLKPKIIIIPINLRSFSPGWDMLPVYQFEREQFYFSTSRLLAYFYKPLAIMKAINTNAVTYSEYLELPVYYGNRKIGMVSEFDNFSKFNVINDKNIRDKFIFDYMYDLSNEHRKIKSMLNIINTAKNNNIQLYIYVTPIDIDNGVKYVGNDFVRQTKKNSNYICYLIKKENLPCLNLSQGLNSSNFNYSVYPNEHLNEKGRRFVAEKISELLK